MNQLDSIIATFEKNQLNNKTKTQNLGIIYTPFQLVKFMVFEAFKTYVEASSINTKEPFHFNYLKDDLPASPIKKNIRILDPACGSGRFLEILAEFLFNIFRTLDKEESTYNLKKKIIENNIFGNDIEEESSIISKLRLLNWLNRQENDNPGQFEGDETIKFKKLEELIESNNLNFNISNKDFLLDYNRQNFDIIIGNPPYVENKKIIDSEYKNELVKKFHSAYRLFDLSILFIEQSINLLKEKSGVLAFLIPNKFLSANYGIKIRQILLRRTQIKEIIKISSLPVFKGISTYPVILFLLNNFDNQNSLLIKEANSINELKDNNISIIAKFAQEKMKSLPSFVIPLSKDIELINKISSKFKVLDERFENLKIIYRPFGFIDWAGNSKNIIYQLSSNKDLILLGTGNIGKYHINFKKPIKVAKNIYSNCYFKYNEKYKDIWDELTKEKLIFREIGKNLTFAYDSGIFSNLTGLYFIRIPSLKTIQLFSLLCILNSKLLNTIFKTLFGTLHMSGGYMRINGSFIKSLPIPLDIPEYLGRISKILHFLTQLKIDSYYNKSFNPFFKVDLERINQKLSFYQDLSNLIVNHLYELIDDNLNYDILRISENSLPDLSFKYFYPYYNHPQYKLYSTEETIYNYRKIEKNYTFLKSRLDC